MKSNVFADTGSHLKKCTSLYSKPTGPSSPQVTHIILDVGQDTTERVDPKIQENAAKFQIPIVKHSFLAVSVAAGVSFV